MALDALATSSIVCGEENDCAVGSSVGVDDHSIKLPLLCESLSCVSVTAWWVLGACLVDEATANGLSISNCGCCIVISDGCVSWSSDAERCSSVSSVWYCGSAAVRCDSSNEARVIGELAGGCDTTKIIAHCSC